jgi:deazaflavin-dependent oxidoreductase (nitroreductase family)
MSDWQQKLAGLRDVRTCRITTRGRKTGRPHTVTIWFVVGAEEQRVYLGTLRMGRDWPRNVAANPEVTVDIADLRLQGRARVVTDDGKRQRVESALAAKYWGVWIGSWLGLRPQGVFEVELGGEAAS